MTETATVEPVETGEDEAFWYRGCEQCSETGQAWQGGEEFGECERCSGRGFIWAALDDILEGVHPALPRVAQWLSENPNATERLWHVLDIYGNSAHAEGDAEQTLSSLIEALSHD